MKTEISISGTIPPESFSLVSDEYIPLAAYTDNMDADIRGHFKITTPYSLLDICVASCFLKIRSVKLILFDTVHHPFHGNPDLPRKTGLPIIEMLKVFEKRPDDILYIDIKKHISIALDNNSLEIDFGCIAQATHIIASGPLEFYVDGAMIFKEKDYGDDPWDTKRIAEADLLDFYVQPVSLCGLRVTGLQEEQTDTLRKYHFNQKF